MRASKTATPQVHLNLNVRGLPISATLAINELSNRLRREGRKVYRLGLGQSPFPVPQPVVDELKANAHQKDYLPVLGLEKLRETVSDYYCRTQGINREPDGVMIGPGSKELMFLVQLVYYGDLVIPTPSWVSYAPQAHIIGRQIRWLPTREEEGWKITPEAVERLCREDPHRPRLIILNYPNNPSGATYLLDELKALAQVARKYRVLLLSDEIYGELNHKGVHISIARLYPEGTIISSGLSKWCGAGGWHLGTFVFPRSLYWLRDAMAAVASETFTSTSAPIQYAAVRAFQGGMELERYLWQSRRILRALGRWCYHHLLEEGIQAVEPKGGFYLFVNFEAYRPRLADRGIFTCEQLCQKLLEDTGVAILPGSAFGRPADELTARLAYVDFDGARCLAAAEQVPSTTTLDETFLRTYCINVVEAIELMGQWVAR